MTWKQLEAKRATRLWISQIVIPTATAVVTVMTIPEVRQAIVAKAKHIKYSIEQKLHKN